MGKKESGVFPVSGLIFLSLFFWVVGAGGRTLAFGQEVRSDTSLVQEKAIKVFLDVSSLYQDHIKREIPYVNYVRDRKEAQIYLMLTTQPTGSGGIEHTLFFLGQKEFKGQNDTLKYVSKQSDTEEMIRSGIVKMIKAGLMRFVAKTPLFKDVMISYTRKATPTEVVDKWNNWVFNINLHGFFNGEESRKSHSLSGSISADRVTPEWKLSFGLSSNYNEDRYKYQDYSFLNITRSQNFRALVVKSLTEHWSTGLFAAANSSTYGNTKFSGNFSPAIEFNVFPYSQSTRREFRFLYKLGYSDVQYRFETIYDKLRDRLFAQSLSATLELKEKWGSVSTTLSGSNYFHDFSKNRFNLFSNLNIRLFEGFSIDLFGSVSLIHDQLSLRKKDFALEDILLHREELSTSYNYFASIGLRYTFGSIYSNVVNPRFGSSGGGTRIMIMF